MAAKRLTRKEIVRKDRIQQTLTETSGWLVRNLTYILGIAAILILAVGATYLWRSFQQSSQAEVQNKFSDALAKYHARVAEEEDFSSDSAEVEGSPPSTKYEYATAQERSEAALSAFREVTEEYPGTRLGTFAQYYVGLALIDLDIEAEAREELNSLIAEAKFPDIVNLARNALAQLAVSEGNEEEAIRLLNEILDEPSSNFPQQMVLMRLAESYEAVGDSQAALRTYRRVSAEYPGSTFATKSDAKIDALELRGVTVEEDELQPPETPEQ